MHFGQLSHMNSPYIEHWVFCLGVRGGEDMAHLTIPPPPVPGSDAATRSVPVRGCVSSAQRWTHRADLCRCASRRRSRLFSRLQHAPCQVCVPDLTQRRCLPARSLPGAATLLRCPHPAGYRCPVAHQQPSPCCPGRCACVLFSYAQDYLMPTLPFNNLLFLACNSKDSIFAHTEKIIE